VSGRLRKRVARARAGPRNRTDRPPLNFGRVVFLQVDFNSPNSARAHPPVSPEALGRSGRAREHLAPGSLAPGCPLEEIQGGQEGLNLRGQTNKIYFIHRNT